MRLTKPTVEYREFFLRGYSGRGVESGHLSACSAEVAVPPSFVYVHGVTLNG